MADGISISEVPEIPRKSEEVFEAKDQLDQAAYESDEALAGTGDYKQAEAVEGAIKEAVQVAEGASALEKTPTITLEGADQAGTVTIAEAAEVADPVAIIDSNDGASREAIIDSNDGVSREAIIDSNDGTSTEAIIDSNDGTSREAIIDSNDGASREAIIDSNDGTSREAIIGVDDGPGNVTVQGMPGDSHLMEDEEDPIQGMTGAEMMEDEEGPVQARTASQVMEEEEPVQGRTAGLVMEEEEPVQGRTASQVMEGEEPVQGLTNPEIVSQLMDQLPEGAASFTSQAAADIIETVMAGESNNYLSPTRDAIQGQFENISADQVNGLLAVSLLKAAQVLDSGTVVLPDQPPDPGTGSGINPNYPGTDPAGSADQSTGGVNSAAATQDNRLKEKEFEKAQAVAQQMVDEFKSGADSAQDMWKYALQLLKEVNERQQQNVDKMTT